jgi:YggT family protein
MVPLVTVLNGIHDGVRYLVAGAFVLAAVVAITYWAVRQNRLAAFGGWARFVRRWGDPMLRPIERRLARGGGNPQDATLWLVGITVVAGLALIALVDWLIGFGYTLYTGAQQGLFVPLLVRAVFELLKLAILIRVLASWVSVSPYARVMRVIHGLTDWLIDPIRRVLPTMGMLDFSPLVAYLVLSLAETLVLRGLFT